MPDYLGNKKVISGGFPDLNIKNKNFEYQNQVLKFFWTKVNLQMIWIIKFANELSYLLQKKFWPVL